VIVLRKAAAVADTYSGYVEAPLVTAPLLERWPIISNGPDDPARPAIAA
jgi:hypothetical protein